jgi:hypothetical protein
MDSELLKEYVLNEDGEIYVGSYRSIMPRKWLFGQVRNLSQNLNGL